MASIAQKHVNNLKVQKVRKIVQNLRDRGVVFEQGSRYVQTVLAGFILGSVVRKGIMKQKIRYGISVGIGCSLPNEESFQSKISAD